MKKLVSTTKRVRDYVTLKYLGAQNFLHDLKRREEGATAAEYALMAALIAVVIITAVTALGKQIKAVFEKITNALG